MGGVVLTPANRRSGATSSASVRVSLELRQTLEQRAERDHVATSSVVRKRCASTLLGTVSHPGHIAAANAFYANALRPF